MPSDTQIAPHVEELARALEGIAGPESIREELERYMAHGVPLHQAKRDILTALGGGRPRAKKVKNVTPTDQAVDLVVRVVTVNERQVTARGEEKTIWSGLVGDETGVISYTAWEDVGLEAGQTLRISNARVTTWNGNPQINIGDRTGIEATDEEIVVPPPTRRGIQATVKELKPGLSSVTVTGRVLSVSAREITVQGEPKTLWEGELADETGRVPYTAWHDHELAESQVIKIENGYVRSFRGIASLNFGDSANVTVLEDGDLPPAGELKTSKPYTLEELEDAGGALGVRVLATVLDIKPGSGLILRCPECRRVLQKRECRLHGKVDGLADLRVKAVVDDGTGAVTALFNKPLTEEVLGKDLEACQAAAKEAMTFDVIADEIAAKLLCRRLVLEGNASHDDFGTTLLVTEFSMDPMEDLAGDAEDLLERIQAVTQEVSA